MPGTGGVSPASRAVTVISRESIVSPSREQMSFRSISASTAALEALRVPDDVDRRDSFNDSETWSDLGMGLAGEPTVSLDKACFRTLKLGIFNSRSGPIFLGRVVVVFFPLVLETGLFGFEDPTFSGVEGSSLVLSKEPSPIFSVASISVSAVLPPDTSELLAFPFCDRLCFFFPS
jgi:hypothetical protein